MQYTGEQPLEELRLRVYAGSGESTLYEDAGEGFAYEQGDYRWSYFTCKFLTSGQFALEWRRAGRYQPAYQQVRVEVVGISAEPESVMLDGQGAPVWYFEGGIVELVAGTFDDAHIIGPGGETDLAEDTLLHPPGRST
jgi:alpha-glucosidase